MKCTLPEDGTSDFMHVNDDCQVYLAKMMRILRHRSYVRRIAEDGSWRFDPAATIILNGIEEGHIFYKHHGLILDDREKTLHFCREIVISRYTRITCDWGFTLIKVDENSKPTPPLNSELVATIICQGVEIQLYIILSADEWRNMKKQKKKNAGNEERRLNLERESLQREIRMGVLNNKRLRSSWMKVMTKLKLPVMKEEIAITRASFDRAIDSKEFKMKSLINSLDEAEEQYNRNIGGHMEAIERLERIYDDRMNDERVRYEKNLNEIVEEEEINNAKIKSEDDDGEALLKSVMTRGMRSTDELLEKIQSEGAYKLDNLREDGSQSTKMALLDLEIKIRFYWNFLDSVISKYFNDTRHRRMSYESLKVKDTRDREMIRNQSIEIIDLLEAIHKYRKKIEELQKSANDDALNIKIEKSLSSSAYSSTKEHFHNEQVIDKTQLSYMIKHFKLTSKNLEGLVKKAEAILSLSRICRKFERKDEIEKNTMNRGKKHLISEDEFGCFEFFWYRVCSAQLDAIVLKNERERLYNEKNLLQKDIKRRIIGDSFESPTEEFSVLPL